MAGKSNKVDISTTLKVRLEDAGKLFQTQKARSEYSSKDLTRLEALFKEGQTLTGRGEKMNMTDVTRFGAVMNEIVEIMKKAALASGGMSEALKQLVDTQTDYEQQLKEQRKIRRSVRGRVDETSGKFSLYNTRADEIVQQGNLFYKNGRQVKTYAALQKGYGTKDWASRFQSADAAEALMKRVETERSNQAELWAKSNAEIQRLIQLIDELQVKIRAQSGLDKEKGLTGAEYGAAHGIKAEVQKDIGEIRDKAESDFRNQQTLARTDSLTKSINKQQSALSRAFKAFTIYNTVLRLTKQALRDAVTTVKELDKSLTEQAMVTGLTRDQTYALLDSYRDLALQTGATTKEIASVATEYMKQGKSIEDSLKLTEAAVSAAKVARVSVGDSVNYLTTALNGFRLSAEDAMRVSDKFAAVAAASATDYDELAIALSKVASQANLAGMSIDYTTALLTKGLETTREAPETMGTALKTIIARMRELTDYGETLEGDTDINNVESQLAYVGIALRNQQGELRSTEEVLDELGRKWDSLNQNQQAALAKALAGTRQQSRLIAMMDDYERVIELQDIAQRSQGATLAQADTFLSGIEAALNKISVSWEGITSTLVNSEFVITVLDNVSRILTNIGEVLDTGAGQLVFWTAILGMAASLVSKKIVENNLAKQQIELQRLQNIEALKEEQANLASQILERAGLELSTQDLQILLEKVRVQKILNKRKLEAKQIEAGTATTVDETMGEAEIAQAEQKIQTTRDLTKEQDILNAAMNDGSVLGTKYASVTNQLNYLQAQSNNLLGMSTNLLALSITLTKAKTIWDSVWLGVSAWKKGANKEETASIIANTVATKANTNATIANWVAKIGPVGWVISALLLVTGLIKGLFILFGDTETAVEKATNKVNDLSSEIYKLNESKTAVDSVIKKFDEFDQKIIKTKEDIQAMEESIDAAADKIDWTRGGTIKQDAADQAKANFQALSLEQQIVYFKEEQERIDREIAEKREEQLRIIGDLTKAQQAEILKDANVAAAVYATNNAYLYEQLDILAENKHLADEEVEAARQLGEQILANLDAQTAYNYALNNGAAELAKILTQLEGLNINGESVSVAEILTSTSYSVADQLKAYEQALNSLSGVAKEALREEFRALDTMLAWDAATIALIDNLQLTSDEINKMGEAMQKVGVKSDQVFNRFESFLQALQTMSVREAIETIFSDVLSQFEYGSDAYIQAYNTLLNTYADIAGTGILNMGQNIEKFKNTVDNFYEKSTEWHKMSDSEKTDFINSNADLFADGSLLKAMETGDYAEIQKALENNNAMMERLERERLAIETELAIEEAKIGEDRNESYIALLKQYLKEFNNGTKILEASLELRLQKEEEQLEAYKDYLKEEHDATIDSLEKRKEAYEKYFDDISQETEDAEYEETRARIVANMSKLGGSASGASRQQMQSLQNELEELEKERLQTLRERAQEAVLNSMENELSEINAKFDKLIESNRALLAALTGELDNNAAGFLADNISRKVEAGWTNAQIQEFITKTLPATYGSSLEGVNWDNISTSVDNNNNLVLNIAGERIVLSETNQNNLYQTIYKALQQMGVSF